MTLYEGYYENEEVLLKITCNDEFVLKIEHCKQVSEGNENELVLLTKQQLADFFNQTINHFSLPIDLTYKTEFQQLVLNYLITHPNQIITYRQLATNIGHPNASRAVGTVMKTNEHPIIIPCHLVVKNDGIGNYTNASVEFKNKLIYLSTGDFYE